MAILEEIIKTSIERHRETGHGLELFVLTWDEAEELIEDLKVPRLPDHIYLTTGDKVKLIVGP